MGIHLPTGATQHAPKKYIWESRSYLYGKFFISAIWSIPWLSQVYVGQLVGSNRAHTQPSSPSHTKPTYLGVLTYQWFLWLCSNSIGPHVGRQLKARSASFIWFHASSRFLKWIIHTCINLLHKLQIRLQPKAHHEDRSAANSAPF